MKFKFKTFNNNFSMRKSRKFKVKNNFLTQRDKYIKQNKKWLKIINNFLHRYLKTIQD